MAWDLDKGDKEQLKEARDGGGQPLYSERKEMMFSFAICAGWDFLWCFLEGRL